jgi:hypothetical protein
VYQVVGNGLSSTATVSITIPALPGPTASSRNACFARRTTSTCRSTCSRWSAGRG